MSSRLIPLRQPVSYARGPVGLQAKGTARTQSRQSSARQTSTRQTSTRQTSTRQSNARPSAVRNSQSRGALQVVPQPTQLQKAAQSDAQNSTSSVSIYEMPLAELSNNDLVSRCQDASHKDRAAFEELVNRYQRYVDKLLYHLASDWSDRADLAQEVWIRVYRSIHRLKEPAKFKSWLGRITTNLFYDELRKRKRFKGSISLDAPRYSSDGQYDWELPSVDPTPSDTMMTQEFHDHLKQAMAELPDVFQKTIAMRELQGLSYEEIANITGVSLGTVKSRIARARQRLQEKLKVYLNAEEVPAK